MTTTPKNGTATHSGNGYCPRVKRVSYLLARTELSDENVALQILIMFQSLPGGFTFGPILAKFRQSGPTNILKFLEWLASQNYGPTDCKSCNGTGLKHIPGKERCPHCNGTGLTAASLPPATLEALTTLAPIWYEVFAWHRPFREFAEKFVDLASDPDERMQIEAVNDHLRRI